MNKGTVRRLLRGALSAGTILAMDRQRRDIPPVTGENYREFLGLLGREKA